MCSSAQGLTTAVTAIGGPLAGLSVAGPLMEGDAAKASADFQAQISRNNAIIARRNAADTRDRGQTASGEQGVQTAQLIARQRVALAASGQVVDIGSGAEIVADTAAQGKLDSLRIVNNAEREALGLAQQGDNFTAQASAQVAEGKNALTASRIQALNSLVNTGTQVAKFAAMA